MRKWLDRLVNIYEFFIAYLFLRGAWNVYHAEAVVEGGVVDNLTSREAIVVYACILGVLGLLLPISKIFKQRQMHGWTLLGMYLIAFYIVTLSLVVNGWDDGLILSIFYTLSMGGLYLYWRYKIINDKLIHKISAE